MNEPSEARRKHTVASPFSQQLATYTLAASAAGVGVMALPLPLHADIVYTPANVTIDVRQTIFLDLNNDGITDFRIDNAQVISYNSVGSYFPCPVLDVRHKADGGVLGPGGGVIKARAAKLRPGRVIGSSAKFQPRALMFRAYATYLGCSVRNAYGQWKGPFSNGYLGFKFTINGETHFGWAHFGVSAPRYHQIKASLLGYAYETDPNKSIQAGQTQEAPEESSVGPQPTLGMLAAGSLALDAWRRDDDVVAK